MIYTMNGMRTQLNLRADEPGTFRGQSSHYSGDGFSDMDFDVQAVPAEQFTAWIGSTRSMGPALDAQSYRALAKQSVDATPFTLNSVDPELFSADHHAETPARARPADRPARLWIMAHMDHNMMPMDQVVQMQR